MGKRRVELSLFADDLIFRNRPPGIHKIIIKCNKFSKIAGYKVNIKTYFYILPKII
jgi:hypothetical protein